MRLNLSSIAFTTRNHDDFMDINEFTQRSQQAIVQARDLAAARNHQYVQPEHLLEGLLAQQDGILYPILSNLGVHVTDVRGPLEAALDNCFA